MSAERDVEPCVVHFEGGTLLLRGRVADVVQRLPACLWDARSRAYRLPAQHYAALIRTLHRHRLPHQDRARAYEALTLTLHDAPSPRPYQVQALAAWQRAKRGGVVVLPTGAGKTLVALLAILDAQRSTIVLAPTLDLVRQWHQALHAAFCQPIGVLGGGEYRIEALTVSTYDSAYLHMDRLGDRFGLLIADECHHLPSDTYALAARCTLAPFRLGLTATPEREDGRETELDGLLGPVVYRQDIIAMAGHYLADYDVERIWVELDEEEQIEFDACRSTYRSFVAQSGMRIDSPQAWVKLLQRASRSADGRAAVQAYRRQRQLAFAPRAKFAALQKLLHRHRHGRTLIFTQENATAYAISARLLIPVITHQSKVSERSEILTGLRQGRYHAVVTSKVLNEGVDVPEADVAVIISGSGSVREHVQRLGRILRKQADKRATLYELVTQGTGERYTSARRREHSAYR